MTVTSEPRGRKPDVPGLVKLQTVWAADLAKWTTALHVLKSVASFWSNADMTAVLNTLEAAIAAHIKPLVGVAVANTGNIATDLTSPMGIEMTGSGAGAGSGPGTTPLPINVALRSTDQSVMQYRGGRPGNFWGGLDASDIADGSTQMWLAATRTAWIAGLNALYTELAGTSLPSGATCVPVWVSYFKEGAFRTPPLTFPVNSGLVEVQQRICSRRRRLGKGVPGE